ncbi:MAG: hypothetical protein JWP06_147 [Candidatus Saccharibacteria bacterium]|nr:hypothetical protein [Candidatus Saccharibacteria bacterium]
MNQDYYQIYEGIYPLKDKCYPDIRTARVRLKELYSILQDHGSTLGYTVENRIPMIPIRNTLGVRLTYADGSSIHRTYTIRHVQLRAIQVI